MMENVNWNNILNQTVQDAYELRKNNATRTFLEEVLVMNPNFEQVGNAFVVDTPFGQTNISISRGEPECRQFHEDSEWLLTFSIEKDRVELVSMGDLSFGACTRIGPDRAKYYNVRKTT
jgi:hypothetical protein